ncbi:MAG: DnaJ domain-containing protein [Candidatus Kapabacteria bacterium]|nr:DnaJ domain-containing protein [Candidatus Kapabacteria bacterium]
MKYFRFETSADEAARAFRLLSVEMHPDKKPNDPRANDNFSEMKQEYEDFCAFKRHENEILAYYTPQMIQTLAGGFQAPQTAPKQANFEDIIAQVTNLVNGASNLFSQGTKLAKEVQKIMK